MKIILESTADFVTIAGVPARVWKGHTASGHPLFAFIPHIAVPTEVDQAEFEAELLETVEPGDVVNPYGSGPVPISLRETAR